jgi:hypothetical protein
MTLPEPTFVPIEPEYLPQDPRGDGTGWTFRTLEHDQHTFPTAIEAKDAQGRTCVYVPLRFKGEIGRPLG